MTAAATVPASVAVATTLALPEVNVIRGVLRLRPQVTTGIRQSRQNKRSQRSCSSVPPLDSECSTGGGANDELVHSLRVGEVEQMASSPDDVIGRHATKRNHSITVAVNVMNRHR